MQEKQIRAKQSIKQFSSRMRDQRLQVADKVKKSMEQSAGIIPKVLPPAGSAGAAAAWVRPDGRLTAAVLPCRTWSMV